MSENPEPEDRLLTPGQVARIFSVQPSTVRRWAQAGTLPCLHTPSGHRRYKESVVQALLAGGEVQ
jgi:excisionase family DNA binding protein